MSSTQAKRLLTSPITPIQKVQGSSTMRTFGSFGLLLQFCEFDNLICSSGASHIDIQIANGIF